MSCWIQQRPHCQPNYVTCVCGDQQHEERSCFVLLALLCFNRRVVPDIKAGNCSCWLKETVLLIWAELQLIDFLLLIDGQLSLLPDIIVSNSQWQINT